jgi:hypothetical protein
MQLTWIGVVSIALADVTQMRDEGHDTISVAVDSVGDVPLLGSHPELEIEDAPKKLKMVSVEQKDKRQLSLWEEMRRDPVVVVSLLLLIAGLIAKLIPQKKAAAKKRPSASSVALNKQLRALSTAGEVLDAAVAGDEKADLLNLLTALQRAAKLRARDMTAEDPRVLSLFQKVVAILQKGPQPGSARAVSTTTRVLVQFQGKAEKPSEAVGAVLDGLIDYLRDHIDTFENNELTHAVCAFSDLRYRRSDVLQACVKSSSRWNEWSEKQHIWMSWACARLVTQSSARALPETAATLRDLNALLLKVDCPAVPTRLVGMLAWSAVQLHLSLETDSEGVKSFLWKLADDAAARVKQFATGEACSVLWALGKCGVEHTPFLDAWRDRALAENFGGYKGMDMANIVCAYVNTNHGDDAFLARCGVAIETGSFHFTDVERQMVRWAFARRPLLVMPKLK